MSKRFPAPSLRALCLTFALPILALPAPFPGEVRAALPDGFVIENAFPGVNFAVPVAFAFLPDGRTLVAEKSGYVRLVLANGTQAPLPFLDLTAPTYNSGDLGLLGLAVDPDFETNRWVYVLYTVDTGADDRYSRLVRYQASLSDPNVADVSTKQVLIGDTWPEGIPTLHTSHSVCSIRFGEDKSLLIGHGDGGRFEAVDAGGQDPGGFGPGKTDPAEDIGAFRARAVVTSMAGKILRLDKETGLGLPSNPFWDGDPGSDASRVWAYGLRNPFRFSLRPGTGSTDPADGDPGTLYIGDVGWNIWEEVNVASTGGTNFGWPCWEGPLNNSLYQNVDETAAGNEDVLCDAGLSGENPSSDSFPVVWWHHSNPSSSNPPGLTALSVTGGVFYEGGSYPAEYVGRYFVGAFVRDWILTMDFDETDAFLHHSIFTDAGDHPVYFDIDPATGDVCYVAIFNGTINRIRYEAPADAPAPVASGATERVRWSSDGAPNPFSDHTALSFVLEREQLTSVDVFDLEGRLVANALTQEARAAGTYQVTWDGMDADGNEAASGVYFMVLRSANGGDTRKVVLARN